MSQRRIIIVGGGMAGLSAAYQLSLTSELRKQYHVTVYQLGWRLGGKCASGRDAQGRNIEHGLHIWFGHYLNAFQMLAEVYRDLPRKGAKVDLNTLILPQGYTPIGDPDGVKPTVYDVNFPTSKKVGIPGREPADLSIANCLSHAIGLLIDFHDYALGSDSPIVKLDEVSIETIKMRDDPRFPPSRLLGVVTARTCLEIASAWLLHLDEDMISFGPADMELVRRVLQGAAGASCHMTFANTASRSLVRPGLATSVAAGGRHFRRHRD
ncbi:NAD(P)-binding protein [Bradyrhizobium sp. BR 1433]|uniref:NAD(P)-binding protein n=1 Tax=Bradyrhizobium sp. BR 1433 TaxID=3447967 RepID=UPI003EE66B3C